MSPDEGLRPAVIAELYANPTDPELLLNATPAERRVAADLHWKDAIKLVTRAKALAYAMKTMQPHWRRVHGTDATFTISKALKIVPKEVADDVLGELYDNGWTAEEIVFPDPRRE